MAAWDPSGSLTTTTVAAEFIPQLWSDEVIAAYKANLVVAGLVTSFNHRNRKGDVINIPVPGRNGARKKTSGTEITVDSDTAGTKALNIDQHAYIGYIEEDIVMIQGLDSRRQHQTDDMGYALATSIDTDLMTLYSGFQSSTPVIGGDGSTAWSATSSGNGTALTDAGIRKMIRTLDDANVPQSNRSLVIPPVTKENLLGLPRFTEQAFVGESGAANSIRNGRLGQIYGVDVYVSTNCPAIESADSTNYRVGLMFHRSAMALITQLDVTFETERKLQYLGDLTVAHTLYGFAELRDDAAVAFVVPA